MKGLLKHIVEALEEDGDVEEFGDYADLSPDDQIRKHQARVKAIINVIIAELGIRAETHDASKLQEPEISKWREYIPTLSKFKYGTEEYKKASKDMGDVIGVHQKANRHHPEFYKDGIKGMSLVDLVELICDWKAASERTNGGDIKQSVEDNQKRFGYSDDVKALLLNTIALIEGKQAPTEETPELAEPYSGYMERDSS